MNESDLLLSISIFRKFSQLINFSYQQWANMYSLYPSIFCAGDCLVEFNGASNIIDGSKGVLPNVKDYTALVPANTGHAAFMHFSAPSVFEDIQSWIQKRFP